MTGDVHIYRCPYCWRYTLRKVVEIPDRYKTVYQCKTCARYFGWNYNRSGLIVVTGVEKKKKRPRWRN